jgi:hypothetical protein
VDSKKINAFWENLYNFEINPFLGTFSMFNYIKKKELWKIKN